MGLTPDELGKKIKEARERDGQNKPSDKEPEQKNKSEMAKAMRAGTDMVAAIFVGGFLGYWIDEWLGVRPLAMIMMLFIGFAAGFLNIYRSQTGQDYKVGFKDENKNKE